MAKRIKMKPTPWYVLVLLFITVSSLILALCMIVPLWLALAVGITNVSIVIFSISLFAAALLLWVDKRRLIRLIATISIFVSLISLVVPQIGFLNTAHRHGAKLSFDPVSYLTFSGATDITPTHIKTYKTVGKRKLALSFYKTDKTGDAPLVVLLHGGAWRYGSHLETGIWPQILTNAGYSVASIEYRLSNDSYHSWEDTPADVHDGIKYLKTNAEALSIDPERMHLMGQSAGGHLALLEAYRFESVKSVIALYAPIDLTLDYETSRDKTAELDFIGGPPKQFRERYEALSPISYINHREPRTLIVQGLYDDLVHPSQATQLRDVLNKFGTKNEVVMLPLTGHSFENQRGGFSTQITTQRVLEFLK